LHGNYNMPCPSQIGAAAQEEKKRPAMAGEHKKLMEWIGWTIRTVFAYVVNLTAWDVVGYVGQLFFLSRFIVQWIVTERKRKSTIPVAFWYLSLVGTIILLTYSIHLRNPIFILGFSLNMVIYLRNLYFIHLRPGQAR